MHRGQALVEFALVCPILFALMLGTIEAGVFGLRLSAWQGLARTVSEYAAAEGALPDWWQAEALRASCGDPAALWDTSGEPWRLSLTCSYSPIALPGFSWRVTVEALG